MISQEGTPTEATFTLRFGILGTGSIAKIFVDSLLKNQYDKYHVEFTAVVSRQVETARQFVDSIFTATQENEKNTVHVYGSYTDFFKDENVDIVYVASPHYFHYEHCKMALK